jgi:hypothetical protein
MRDRSDITAKKKGNGNFGVPRSVVLDMVQATLKEHRDMFVI